MRENVHLQQRNKMLQEFNAAVNHELITPLRCLHEISLKVESQLKNMPEPLRYMKLITNQAQFLFCQVKSNMDKCMLDADQLTTDPGEYRLNNIIPEIVDLLNFSARNKQVKIEY